MADAQYSRLDDAGTREDRRQSSADVDGRSAV